MPVFSPTRRFAQHAAELRYDDLPPALVALVKQCVLDTLGVSLAATTLAPEAGIVHEYVRSRKRTQRARSRSSAISSAFPT